ncbi:facilitated trehalose transporter Tret1 isoform X3 [Plutella xylostella]|uniref:facilitated trehalose transporter Tret1 isoform X3 n=1 Tax=Plutella xylostella TaxID=51655 RepID=UPI0020323497|nr:facilitated trehalose transporter Tret1 isoform X3 [Plutella xylostella]
MTLQPKFKQTIFALPAHMSLVNMGMMYGYPAILTPALLSATGDEVKADKHTASWLASLPGFTALVLVVVVGPLMSAYGRRPTQLITTSLVLAGWLVTAFATSITALFAGRALQGVCNGCLYFNSILIGEISSPSIRGVLLNVKLVSVSLGILIIHGSGCILQWRSVAWVGTVPCLISIAITLCSPETPDWLVSKGRFEEAETAFFTLRGRSNESKRELSKLIDSQKQKRRKEIGLQRNSFMAILGQLKCKAMWRPVILLTCATVIPEAGGRHFFPSYSVQLAEQITGDKTKGLLYTIIMDVISVLAGIICTLMVGKFSRRGLTFYCGFTANVLLIVSCFFMYLQKTYVTYGFFMWLSVSFLVLYYIIVNGSVFGICYVLMGELLPLEFRATGVVIDGIVSAFILTFVIKVTPYLKDSLGIDGMLFVFALCMASALIYMYYDLPETKNRTLHDIGEYFRGNSPKLFSDEALMDNDETDTFVISKE